VELENCIARVAAWIDAVPPDAAARGTGEMRTLIGQKDLSTECVMATNAELARAAVHEAAHAVIGQRLGLQVQRALVRLDGSGCVLLDEPNAAVDQLSMAVAALAGPMTSLIVGVDRSREHHLAHGGDVQMARTHLDRCREHLAVTSEGVARIGLCTVLSNWSEISRVASALEALHELRGIEIRALATASFH
jgi:outer membrane murein-binding lipoprotein Lpp